MRSKKVLWKILLVIGCLPFVIVFIFGINASINGFSGLCFCGPNYGFQAFKDSIILFSTIFYPTYIIGVILIIVSIIKLKNIKS